MGFNFKTMTARSREKPEPDENTQRVPSSPVPPAANRDSTIGLALSTPYEEASPAPPPQVTQSSGNIFNEGSTTFRTMTRRDTALVLISNQVGLGILSLPSIMQTLGLIPGTIAIIGVGILSTYTAFVLLQLYRKHPHCVNIVDMARVVGGRPLEILVGVGLMVKICLTCASASVTLSVAFNTISDHSMCTVGWIGVSAALCWLLSLPRTFKFVAQVGIPATISILAAILIALISLGVAAPRGALPGFEKEIKIIGNPDFKQGLRACLNVCYAFAGNVGFPSLFPEMLDPSRDFTPALVYLQIFSIPLYLIVAIGIYCMAGQYTTSPALGSAPELLAKVAYGVVLPAVLATGLVFGHTAVKYMYVVIMRSLKSTDQMTSNSVKAWTVWVSSATALWIVSFVLANAIPIFDSILSISSSTFVAWFTFGISGVFWLFLNWGRLFITWRKTLLTVLNVLIIVQSVFMNAAGLWAAITNLMDIFNRGDAGIKGPFTCADNSLF